MQNASSSNHPYLSLAACLLMAACQALPAADAPLCRAITDIIPQPPEFTRRPVGGELLLDADKGYMENNDVAVFEGSVSVQRKDLVLQAGHLIYRRPTGEIEAHDGVTLWDDQLVLQSDYVQVMPDEEIGGTGAARYWMPERRGRGKADKILKYTGKVMDLFGTTYTTCDPDAEAWSLETGRTRLDFDTDTGKSYSSVLRVGGLPVFYLPYVEYPISDKPKSGLLVPTFGKSSSRGFEFTVPYYWRPAPNYDLTFAPHIMSDRGIALNTEFRYLTRSSSAGAYLEYLPHDLQSEDSRYFLSLRQKTRLSPKLSARILFNQVSDSDYFKDFGDSLDASAGTVNLPRRVNVTYRLPGYRLGLGVRDYQTLLPETRASSYRILPGLILHPTGQPRNRRLNAFLDAEWLRFDRENPGNSILPSASRLDLAPWLSYPLRFSAGFIEPKLVLRYTHYLTEYTAAADRDDSSLARFTPTFSTDMGLFFERENAASTWLQTLEPRLFYQYTPYRNQDEIPVLDTSYYDLSWAQLFRTERFSGPDRVSDEHSVAATLSTRVLERNSGLESLRLGVGQIFYLRDRRVALPRQALDNDGNSALIAEIAGQAGRHLSAAYTVQWDNGTQNSPYQVLRLRYHRSPQQLLNFTYRQRDDRLLLEQTDVSWRWPLNNRWSTLGRWNYSLEHGTDLEELVGLEYNSCCWAVRVVARRYLKDTAGDEYANSFHFQIQLKGLAGLGSTDFLGERIPGYSEDFESDNIDSLEQATTGFTENLESGNTDSLEQGTTGFTEDFE